MSFFEYLCYTPFPKKEVIIHTMIQVYKNSDLDKIVDFLQRSYIKYAFSYILMIFIQWV